MTSLAAGERFTINSRKYDGTIRRSWECELVKADTESVDLIGVFAQSVDHPDLGRIDAGTISRERFYLNRWYNYFVFEQPDSTLRNYYINICMPPTIAEGVIDYVDLDIDLILWPDGRLVRLDLDEFEANADLYRYPSFVRSTARKTLDEIISLLDGLAPETLDQPISL